MLKKYRAFLRKKVCEISVYNEITTIYHEYGEVAGYGTIHAYLGRKGIQHNMSVHIGRNGWIGAGKIVVREIKHQEQWED